MLSPHFKLRSMDPAFTHFSHLLPSPDIVSLTFLKVCMQPFEIQHICDIKYISRRNAIYFRREKLHLHGVH